MKAHEVFDRAEARQTLYEEAHTFLGHLRASGVVLPGEFQIQALSLLARMDDLAERPQSRPRKGPSHG